MKKILNTLAVMCLSTTAFSGVTIASGDDYDSNYYKEEGGILFKVKGSALVTKGKFKNLPARSNPAPNTNPETSVPGLVSNGYSIEGSTTVFFSKNIAGELGVGLQNYKTSASAVNAISNNYSPQPTNSKKKNIYAAPMSLLLQYHVAPYGAIRPYIGAGYQYTWMLSKAKQFTIESGHGYALQVGVDFAMTDDTVMSFDLKRYHLTPKVKFKKAFLGGFNDITSKVNINPVIISAGFGWKF
jgi:outer membrane protein